MFNFILAIIELIGIRYLFNPLPLRFKKGNGVILLVAAAFCSISNRLFPQLYMNDYYLYYYLIIACFIAISFKIEWKTLLYNSLTVFFLSFPLKRLVHHLVFALPDYYPSYWQDLLYLFFSLSILTLFYLVRLALKPRYNRYINFWTLAAMLLCAFSILYMNLLIGSVMDYKHLIAGWYDALLPLLTCFLMSICGLAFVFNNEKTITLIEKEKNLELAIEIKRREIEQIRLKKELIDQTNRKYHDMKNHLNYLKTLSNQDQESYINQIQKQLNEVIPILTTGNAAIDTVLVDKSMLCRKHDISLSVVVEYQNLSFLKPLDIVTIFGNALDNAIEANLKLSAPQRKIRLRITQENNWILIRFANPIEQSTLFKNGYPVSTKIESGHGLGFSSIKTTAEQLGGIAQIQCTNKEWVLTIFLPLNTD